MKYDELLNHKSILDCENPRDQEQHGKDKMKMLDKMDLFGVYGGIAKIQPQDKAHLKDKTVYRVVRLGEYADVVEGCDLKNGTDMVIHDGVVGIATYGQNYIVGLKKESHMVETLVSFRYFDNPSAVEKYEDMTQEQLEHLFHEGEEFLNTREFFQELRGVRRKDLDVLISEAEERRQDQDNRGKEKGKEKEVGRQ